VTGNILGILRRLGYRLCLVWWKLSRPITVGVRAILAHEGKVLLVFHSYQDAWYLPGGGVKKGETLENAMAREAAEEVGASLGEVRLLGVYSSFYEGKSDHVAVFVCASFSMTGETDGEIARWGFFEPDRLPEAVSPGTRRRLREYVADQGPYVRRW
jgi:ADP-ribose pyrophosphatase YjhB (NUDIX family)